jgi:transcriptional regulator with XRE-family HTH domain
MAKRQPPRVTLAKNLRMLIAASGMASPEVAKKAGVDAKTMNNMLNGRYDPRPDKVEQVAAVFGLTAWQMLIPDLPEDMLHNGRLSQVVENYVSAGTEGRDSIHRVAEMAARYHKA